MQPVAPQPTSSARSAFARFAVFLSALLALSGVEGAVALDGSSFEPTTPGVGQDGSTKWVPTGRVRLPEVASEADPALIQALSQAKRDGDSARVDELHRRLGWGSGIGTSTATSTAAEIDPQVGHQRPIRSDGDRTVRFGQRAARIGGDPGGPDPLVYDQQLSLPAFSSIQPSLASRADGTLYAVAVDAVASTLDLYESTNDGYTWTYMHSIFATEPRNPSIVVAEGNTDRLLVAYENDSGGAQSSIRVYWWDVDTVASGDVVIESAPFATLSRPRICVDSPEYNFWYPYLTWTRGVIGRGEVVSVQFSRSLDYAETWQAPVALASGLPSDTQHDIDFGGTRLSVVFSQPAAPDNRDIMIRRSADFGASFDGATALASASEDEFEPRIASTSDEGLTVVAFTKRYTISNTDIESLVTTDGTNWSLTYLPFTGVEERVPDLAASVAGEGVHAAFRRTNEIRSSSIYESSLAWTNGRQVNEGIIDSGYAPAVEASPARTQEAAFAWTQQTPDGSRILFDAEYPVGDYCIIVADDALEAAVVPLVAWKETLGYDVSVISVPTIFETYGSGDDAERIYAYLADRVDDVRHVLLVGDVDLLPMRLLYPSDVRPAYGSDHYYAGVGTLNWDLDADDRWGEFVDDGLDPSPDLIVGRVPFNDVSSVQSFCNHVIAFEQATGSWKRNVLQAYGFLDHVEGNTADPVTDAAYAAEHIISDFLSPSGWGSTTLYEKGGISTSSFACDADLLQANFRAQLGWGQHGIVTTNAHGGPGSKASIQWTADLNENFIRDLPEESRYNSFGNQSDIAADPASGAVCLWGCSTGLLFGWDSGFAPSGMRSRYLIRTPRSGIMVKEYLRHGAGAVIAAMAGSDYRAGWTNPSQGYQQSLAYYFFEALSGGPRRIGDAFHAAAARYADTHGLARGIRVFNVFGDPTFTVDDVVLPPDAVAPRIAAVPWDGTVRPSATTGHQGASRPASGTAIMHASAGPDETARFLHIRSVRGGNPGAARHRHRAPGATPLVWEQPGDLQDCVSVLTLERVGEDILAGGIAAGVAGNQACIFRSSDSGITWTRQDLEGVVSVRAIEQTGSGRLVAAGMSMDGGDPLGVIRTSDDDGASWQERLSFPGGVVTGVVERTGGELFAVTAWNGRIFRSDDDGTSWLEIASLGADVHIARVIAMDERLLVALDVPVGLRPVLYSDDGVVWTGANGLGSVTEAHALVEAPTGELYAGVTGLDGAGWVYRSTNAGVNWEIMGALGDGDVEAVLSLLWAPDGALYAGGSTGWGPSGTRVYRLPFGETDWELAGGEVDLANQVRSMIAVNAHVFLGTGDIYGNVYRLGSDVAADVPEGPESPGETETPIPTGAWAQPNPFTGSTTLRYALARDGEAHVEIFDARGRRVVRLDDGVALPPGEHWIEWNGTDDRGVPLSAGVYYYRVSTRDGASGGSVVLAR